MALGFDPDTLLSPEVLHWAYALLFLTAFLESFPAFGTLVPGGTFLVAAGFASSHGALDVWLLAAVASAGAVSGDLLAFELGHRYGKPLLARFRGRPWLPETAVSRTERALHRNTGTTLVVGRFSSITRSIAPALAGALHLPHRRFLPWAAAAGVLWAVAHALGGHYFGQGFLILLARFGRDALILLAVGVAAWWAFKKWQVMREEAPLPPPETAPERVP